MFVQLNPPLPVEIVDKGKGLAIAVIDYGAEHHLIWVTAMNMNGEIWCVPNPSVRMEANWTMGRPAHPAPLNAPKAEPNGSAKPLVNGKSGQPQPS